MKNIIGIVVVLGIIVVGILYVTADDESNENPIRIGASISLTGSAASFGEMSRLAMGMAVEEINESGGVNGRTVELFIQDDRTVPRDALSAWRKLVDIDNVDAVIGGLFDFTAQPLIPLAEFEEIAFISSNFVIKDRFEMNDYSFVMYPDFEKVISELDSVIADLDVSQMAILRFQSDFGAEIGRVLDSALQDQDRAPLISETYAQIGGSDFRTPILKLKSKGVDTLFLDMLDFDIVTFLKRADELDFKPQIIGHTTIRDVIGKTPFIEGAIMLDWEIPSDAFAQKFEEKYGKKPNHGNNKSYDAVYVLTEALAYSEEDVAGYLEDTAFETVNGTFSFTDRHSIADTPIKIMKVENGELVEIKSNF